MNAIFFPTSGFFLPQKFSGRYFLPKRKRARKEEEKEEERMRRRKKKRGEERNNSKCQRIK